MCKSITAFAPAKINIGLKVFPKRQDCYHDIKSIFTVVNLRDELTVSLSGQNNSCIVECDNFALPKENTFTKAYKAFCVLTGNDRGVHVKVDKKIPAGGGLGGGSSDSSSFLKSIDILLDTHLSDSTLNEISGQVGSDVYFFTNAQRAVEYEEQLLGKRFAALVEGRGDQVSPMEARNDFSVLLVFPGESVSTPLAYSLVDEFYGKKLKGEKNENLEQVYKKPVKDWSFKNDFTVPVISQFPKIKTALESLKFAGADFVDMSGSGSTVFGIFEDRNRALFAKKKLDEDWQTELV